MLTPQQARDIQCALTELRLQHPWHVNQDAMTYTLDCACSRCKYIDGLIVAIVAFTNDTHTP